VAQARAGLGGYLDFYNARRPHSSLDGKTPDTIYFAGLPAMKEAAQGPVFAPGRARSAW
jgi:putative transposase